jgi:hypothetical protein
LGQRLASSEVAAVAGTVEWRERFGAFASDATFRALAQGDVDRVVTWRTTALVRIVRGAEIGASVPWVLSYRAFGGVTDSGGGLGDIRAGGRLTVLPVDVASLVPGVFATLSTTIPSGRPPASARGALQADAVGQGASEISPGIEIEENVLDHAFLLATASVGVFGRETVGARSIDRAPRVVTSLVGGPTFDGGSVGAGVELEREEPPTSSTDRTAPARLRIEPVASALVRLTPDLALSLAARSSLPVDGAGTSDVASVTASAGLRIGVLDEAWR